MNWTIILKIIAAILDFFKVRGIKKDVTKEIEDDLEDAVDDALDADPDSVSDDELIDKK